MMSQSTDDLTRSELRPSVATTGGSTSHFSSRHSSRSRWAGCCSRTVPRTTISGPITKEVVSKNCVAALNEASTLLDRAAQALKDWRLHAKALTTSKARSAWPRPDAAGKRRPRWGLAGADRFDKQADVYKKAATTCK
jgi:hypothetical protein